MFGIVDRLLFRPPELMRDPSMVHRVYIYQTTRGTENASYIGRYARYVDLTKWTTSFSATAGYAQPDIAVGVGDAAREMHIGIVSASFFGFFDAPPAIGRYFTASDDAPPSGAAVAVLSYATWQAQYGGGRGGGGRMRSAGRSRSGRWSTRSSVSPPKTSSGSGRSGPPWRSSPSRPTRRVS